MPAHVTAADADRHPVRGASVGAAGDMLYLTAADTQALLSMTGDRVMVSNSGGTAPTWATLSTLLDLVGSAANGDILYRSGGSWTRLAIGSASDVLTVSGGLPAWAAAAAFDGNLTAELLYVNSDASTTDQDPEIRIGTGDGVDEIRHRSILTGSTGVLHQYTEDDDAGGGTFTIRDHVMYFGRVEGGSVVQRDAYIRFYGSDGSTEDYLQVGVEDHDAYIRYASVSTRPFRLASQAGTTHFQIDGQNHITTTYRRIRQLDSGSQVHFDFNGQGNALSLGATTEDDAITINFADNSSTGLVIQERNGNPYIQGDSTDGAETLTLGYGGVTGTLYLDNTSVGVAEIGMRSGTQSDETKRFKSNALSTATVGGPTQAVAISVPDNFAIGGVIRATYIEQGTHSPYGMIERPFAANNDAGTIAVTNGTATTTGVALSTGGVQAADGGSNELDIEVVHDDTDALNWTVYVEYHIVRNT